MAAVQTSIMTMEEGPVEETNCTGCKLALDEGKAFELANHRWHIECFRCGNCKALLDADANLLLLGDGTLICQGCTYSCFNCGQKIEDLAILTGDQAFCAACFKCRNCKKKIDNLRYARTSMGIFCMECHDMLMARRKKAKDQKTQTRKPVGSRTPGQSPSPMILDKSLPSLPPTLPPGGADYPMVPPSGLRDREHTSRSVVSNDLSASRQSDSPDSLQRKPVAAPIAELSGAPPSARHALYDNSEVLLQPHTYSPTLSQGSGRSPKPSPALNGPPDPFSYISVGFDPTPPTTSSAFPSPQLPIELETPAHQRPSENLARHISEQSMRNGDKSRAPAELPTRNSRPAPVNRDVSYEDLSKSATSHIALLDKARRPSADHAAAKQNNRSQLSSPDPASQPTQKPPLTEKGADGQRTGLARPEVKRKEQNSTTNGDSFKLQDAPKRRRTGSRGSLKSLGLGVESNASDEGLLQNRSLLLDSQATLTPGPRNPKRLSKVPSEASTVVADKVVASPEEEKPEFIRKQSTRAKEDKPDDHPPSASIQLPGSASSFNRPPRGDSLARHASKRSTKPDDEKPLKSPRQSVTGSAELSPKASADSYSSTPNLIKQALRKGHRGQPVDAYAPLSPKSVPNGYGLDGQPLSVETSDASTNQGRQAFLDDSSPTSPPASNDTSYSGDIKFEPSADLLRYSGAGSFTMDDEMTRIMGNNPEGAPNVLRRVSNAVQRHGRSFSDNASQTPRKARTSINEGIQYDGASPSHPSHTSPNSAREAIALKSELRRSQQKIAELEARVNDVDNLHKLDTSLREKRSTMAFLESQREVMLKEMETFAAYHQRAKDSGAPLNPKTLKSEMLQSFAEGLEELKRTNLNQIEELTHNKQELTRDVEALKREKIKLMKATEELAKEQHRLYESNQSLMSEANAHHDSRGARMRRPVDHGEYGSSSAVHGLGIFHHPSSSTLVDSEARDRLGSSHGGSVGGIRQPLTMDDDPQSTIVSSQVAIKVQKGQAKKFSWKKEGKSITGGIKKGMKAAFQPGNMLERENSGQLLETMPYNHTQTNSPTPFSGSQTNEGSASGAGLPRSTTTHKFNLFGNSERRGLGHTGKSQSNSNLLTESVVDPSILFGSELEARAEFEHVQIPSIVVRCIAEVESRGMDVEGIYRRNGGANQVKQIQEGLEHKGDSFDISDPDLDITSVTSLLKQYLRNLPIPLIPFDVYGGFMKAQALTDDESRLDAFRAVIATLPATHRHCLEFVIFHLSRVAEHADENKMDAKNLAVCFSPTIMRTREVRDELTDYMAKSLAVQWMIERNRDVFLGGGDEEAAVGGSGKSSMSAGPGRKGSVV